MDVGNWIRAAEESGELVEVELLDARPGRAMVRVVLDEPGVDREPVRLTPIRVDPPTRRANPPTRFVVAKPRRRRRAWLIGVAVVLVLAAVAGLAVALILAVSWVIAHLAQILGLVGVVAVIVLIAGTTGGGRHCPGC